MSIYPLDVTIKEVLPTYYKDNGFDDDGGKSKPYARLELMPKVIVYIPNTEGRKEVIMLHDIHHLTTGYSNKMLGEMEIAAWELGSNCTNRFIAFLLNVSGLILGLIMSPGKIWNAWKLGRRTKNLYKVQKTEGELREMTIRELQELLKLSNRNNIEIKTKFSDVGLFTFYFVLSLILNILGIITFPLAFIYSSFIALKLKRMETRAIS